MRLLGILAVAVVALASAADGQEQPAPPLYELLPAGGSYSMARVCYTDEGICALPLTVPPGEPCQCRRTDGSWVSGVCTH